MKTFQEFLNEAVKLDKDEQALFNKVKKYPDKTLLSWAGYSSPKEFEHETDEKYSREELIIQNYEDILQNLEELG